MIRAALFDLDGTLVDSNGYHVDTWAEVFAAAGQPVEREAIARQIGKGGDKLVPALLPGLPADEQERLADLHGKRFKALYLGRVRPFPHARDLLARVAGEGIRVVLASSASRAELEHYVRLLDASALVFAGTSIDDVSESKPAPDIFERALEKAGVGADAAVAIGDTPYDMEGARRVGIVGIGLHSGGWDTASLREAGAGTVYADVAALLADFEGSPLAAR